MQGVFSVKSMVYYATHSCYSSYSLVAACSSRECLKLVLVLWGGGLSSTKIRKK